MTDINPPIQTIKELVDELSEFGDHVPVEAVLMYEDGSEKSVAITDAEYTQGKVQIVVLVS